MAKKKAKQVWVFLSDYDGVEGPVTVNLGGAVIPLMTTRKENMQFMRKMAEGAVDLEKRKITLARFEQRVDEEVFEALAKAHNAGFKRKKPHA